MRCESIKVEVRIVYDPPPPPLPHTHAHLPAGIHRYVLVDVATARYPRKQDGHNARELEHLREEERDVDQPHEDGHAGELVVGEVDPPKQQRAEDPEDVADERGGQKHDHKVGEAQQHVVKGHVVAHEFGGHAEHGDGDCVVKDGLSEY